MPRCLGGECWEAVRGEMCGQPPHRTSSVFSQSFGHKWVPMDHGPPRGHEAPDHSQAAHQERRSCDDGVAAASGLGRTPRQLPPATVPAAAPPTDAAGALAALLGLAPGPELHAWWAHVFRQRWWHGRANTTSPPALLPTATQLRGKRSKPRLKIRLKIRLKFPHVPQVAVHSKPFASPHVRTPCGRVVRVATQTNIKIEVCVAG